MRTQVVAAGILVVTVHAAAAPPQTPPLQPDVPASFKVATPPADYVKRDVMIPMRDGVKLHTVIVDPAGARRPPIILTRTPYNATKRADRAPSTAHRRRSCRSATTRFADGSYIRVFQDVRGKYGCEGDYVMTRPLRGPLNDSQVDHSTDAFDTIDWLVKNVPESNGKVGMIGSSYEGFTVLMALINPHPALKAAVPMSPMVDGWKGDDWFHNGAFRQTNSRTSTARPTEHGEGEHLARDRLRRLRHVPPRRLDRRLREAVRLRPAGVRGPSCRAPGLRRVLAGAGARQAARRRAAEGADDVVASLWDQEDMYGAIPLSRARAQGHARRSQLPRARAVAPHRASTTTAARSAR